MTYNTAVLQKGIDAMLHNAYSGMIKQEYLAQIESIITRVASTSASEKYGWLGDLPGVREWVGDKSLSGLADYDYEIKNKDWYDGFSIDRNEIKDEKIAAIGPRVETLAQSLASFPWELVTDLLINGTTGLAYDGAAFFSNRSVNDNLAAGTGVTLATIKADIQTNRAAMMKFKSDTGRVMGLMADTVVVPPELEGTMLEAVESAVLTTSAGDTNYNPTARWIKNVIVSPKLTDANDWYLLAAGMPVKPFIYQDREGVSSVLDDTQVKRSRKLDYSAELRGNAGYGFYQMAIKVVNA